MPLLLPQKTGTGHVGHFHGVRCLLCGGAVPCVGAACSPPAWLKSSGSMLLQLGGTRANRILSSRTESNCTSCKRLLSRFSSGRLHTPRATPQHNTKVLLSKRDALALCWVLTACRVPSSQLAVSSHQNVTAAPMIKPSMRRGANCCAGATKGTVEVAITAQDAGLKMVWFSNGMLFSATCASVRFDTLAALLVTIFARLNATSLPLRTLCAACCAIGTPRDSTQRLNRIAKRDAAE
mmetsp:Transcript_13164/g.29993  ORF Transcript_13164/g.29993 Transcript_13164/m.29993 type:complete len:237 (-) Transcript_13164:421-1131(-)